MISSMVMTIERQPITFCDIFNHCVPVRFGALQMSLKLRIALSSRAGHGFTWFRRVRFESKNSVGFFLQKSCQ
jgi:hypothetical protein